LSDDGEIIRLEKDGATVGSIGTKSGVLWIGGGDTGIYLDPNNDAIRPWSPSSNDIRDNAISLGTSNARFKDLYLSGGVYVGGTTSANLLDDYEEGYHTATVTPATSGTITLDNTFDTLVYTKIGRTVLIQGQLVVSSVASPVGGYVNITLPFTIASLDELSERSGFAMSYNVAGGTNTLPAAAVSLGGETQFRLYVDASTFGASDAIYVGFSFIAA